MADLSYTIDWERRRLLPVRQAHPGFDAAQHFCIHGSKLIEWCGACVGDLDAIAADFSANRAAS